MDALQPLPKFGRNALLIHALAWAALGVCYATAVQVTRDVANDAWLIGAMMAGVTAAVLWCWAIFVAVRSLWCGEALAAPAIVLTLIVGQVAAALNFVAATYHLNLTGIDFRWLPAVRAAPFLILFAPLAIGMCAYWRGLERRPDTPPTSRLWRGLAIVVLCVLAYAAAPRGFCVTMDINRVRLRSFEQLRSHPELWQARDVTFKGSSGFRSALAARLHVPIVLDSRDCHDEMNVAFVNADADYVLNLMADLAGYNCVTNGSVIVYSSQLPPPISKY